MNQRFKEDSWGSLYENIKLSYEKNKNKILHMGVNYKANWGQLHHQHYKFKVEQYYKVEIFIAIIAS